MSIASKFNKAKFDYRPDPKTPFINLEKLYKEFGANMIYVAHACYINGKSKYGEHAVIATDNYMVDMPQHMTDTVKDIIADDEAVKAINEGHFGFEIYIYTKGDKSYFSVNWVDC